MAFIACVRLASGEPAATPFILTLRSVLLPEPSHFMVRLSKRVLPGELR